MNLAIVAPEGGVNAPKRGRPILLLAPVPADARHRAGTGFPDALPAFLEASGRVAAAAAEAGDVRGAVRALAAALRALERLPARAPADGVVCTR